jgi:Family of unknown function (DUF6940)
MSVGSCWLATTERLDGGQVLRLTLTADSVALSNRTVCDLWQRESAFGIFFSETLAAVPFDAFFWEVQPITALSADDPFECVVVDSPALSGVTADGGPFGAQIAAANSDDGIATFGNLGGDALLVAPCAVSGAVSGAEGYAHLAAFVRHAPKDLQYTFWARVGAALTSCLSSYPGPSPVWLSTSGLGVYWLHARLDQYPKYYTHAPYRQTAAN